MTASYGATQAQTAEPTVLKMTPLMLQEMEASIGGMACVACFLWVICTFIAFAFYNLGWHWVTIVSLSIATSYNVYTLVYWIRLHARFIAKVKLLS